MSATYPSTGEFLLSGYGEVPEGALNRTTMETGPAKQAKVRSKELVTREVSYRYSKTDYIAWKVWRASTINRGADWFNWVNPLNGTTVLARIVNGVYQANTFNAGGEIKWDVNFKLETYE